jgi:uncharacterized protein YndB with AHSA1/START domain
MTSSTETAVTTQVHRVYIKASPEAIWEAITDSDWAQRYGYRGAHEIELRPGGAYRVFPTPGMREHGAPDVVVDGEVIEADPPHKLVMTWRMNFAEELTSEPFTRVTYEIKPNEMLGSTRLTIIHELDGAPAHANAVSGDAEAAGGGWPFILSDLKTLLETGSPIAG